MSKAESRKRAAQLYKKALVWDDHSGFDPHGGSDLKNLEIWRKAGVHYLSVNVGYDVVEWQATIKVRDAIGLTTSKDILEAVGRGEGPSKMLVSLGYAGWSAGQIEHELKQNAWLTVEAKDAILFDLPADERLPAAMQLLGIDYAQLADQAGHA